MLKQSAAQASAHWQQGTRVTIWMQASASPAEIAVIQNQLKSLPYVKSCDYYTQAQDYAEAKSLLPNSEASVLRVSDVPSSFRCIPTSPANVFVVETSFTGQPGVYKVTAPEQQVREMQKVIRVAQFVFAGLAIILLVSATVLILNTIRMAIFARRREVAVMKLVGATNWFIRIPFVSEGFVQGLIGSGLATGLLVALLYDGLRRLSGRCGAFRCVDWLGGFVAGDPPFSRRLALGREVNRERVHAVAQTSFGGSVVKHVT
jgi:cell division transport system permease protein